MSAIYGGNVGMNNNIQISPNQSRYNFNANPNRYMPSGGQTHTSESKDGPIIMNLQAI